jgi:uncharacterized protein (DUF58 family)
VSTLTVPAARQGPGRLSPDAVARLDLGLRRRLGGLLPGDHLSAGLGTGTELAQLRPYEPGDDVRRLDPAASARTGVPHVRVHVPERAVTTWLVLDVSASMGFGTADRLKSDVAEGVAEAVGSLAVRRGGRLAITLAGTSVTLPPRGGREALAAVRTLVRQGVVPDQVDRPSGRTRRGRLGRPAKGGPVVRLGEVPRPEGPVAGLGEALLRVDRLTRGRGVVVVVSDFREDAWRSPLRRLAARHAVVAVEIADPREAELPDAGHLHLVDPESGELVEVDTGSRVLREGYASAEAERRAELVTEIRRAGATRVALSTEGDWLRELGRGPR